MLKLLAKTVSIVFLFAFIWIAFPSHSLAALDSGSGGGSSLTLTEGTAKIPTAEDWDAFKQSKFQDDAKMCSVIAVIIGNGPCYKDGEVPSLVLENGQPKVALVKTSNGGAIGLINNAIVALYSNPPLSSSRYLAYMWNKSAFTPGTAYADNQSGIKGAGAGILEPVLNIWVAVRDISYLLFIFIFLVIGFMVMFRQKINPQTVISIQAALPGLVIGLILVTFSYFIASFIMDLLFVMMQMVAQLFKSIPGENIYGKGPEIVKAAQNPNLFYLYYTGIADGFVTLVKGITGQVVTTLTPEGTAVTGTAATALGGMLGASMAGAWGTILGLIAPTAGVTLLVPLLIILILCIAFFVQLIRLLIALVTAYITILIMTLAGPIYILIGSIPGRSGMITNWLKQLFAHALIFPAVFAAFMFSGYLLKANIGSSTLPFFGGVDGNLLKAVLGFGVLLGIASIPDMVKQAFGIKGQSPFAAAAIAGAGAGVGIAKKGFDTATAKYKRTKEMYDKQRAESDATERLGAARPPVWADPGYYAAKALRNPFGWRGRDLHYTPLDELTDEELARMDRSGNILAQRAQRARTARAAQQAQNNFHAQGGVGPAAPPNP